jgi:hypothetical protein
MRRASLSGREPGNKNDNALGPQLFDPPVFSGASMKRTSLVACLLVLFPALSFAQALDPSTVALNAAGAEKFVRATQTMAKSGQMPNVHGGPALDLAKIKATVDGNPAAHKALADAGISSESQPRLLKK